MSIPKSVFNPDGDSEVYIPGALYVDDIGAHWRYLYMGEESKARWKSVNTGASVSFHVPARPLRLVKLPDGYPQVMPEKPAPNPQAPPLPRIITASEVTGALTKLKAYQEVRDKLGSPPCAEYAEGWHEALLAVSAILGL